MNQLLPGLIRLFLISLTLTLTACPANKSKNDDKNSPSSAVDSGSKQHGGYDWGGGSTIDSSPALVIRTIELAQVHAGEPSIHESVFRQFFYWFLTSTADNQKFETNILFSNSGDGLISDVQSLTDSPALKAISLKKINFVKSGDCPHSDMERIADASVSKHSLDGEVCFSTGNLSRIAPSDLTRQVMGLMLHEAVHLAGGDEELARKFQDSFNVYFGIRFGEMLGEAYMAGLAPQILDVMMDFAQNNDHIRQQTPIPHIYGVYGRIYGSLTKLNGVYDLPGLRLRLALRDKKAAEEFVFRISQLKTNLGKHFYLSIGTDGPRVYSYEELASINSELHELSKAVWASWEKLEKAALCDESGKFLYLPKTWLLQDTCKVATN